MFNSGQTLLRSIFSRNQRMFRRMRRDRIPVNRFPFRRYQSYIVQSYQFDSVFYRRWRLVSSTDFNNETDAFQSFNSLCTNNRRRPIVRTIIKLFGVSFGTAQVINECDSEMSFLTGKTSTACCKECETGATKCGCKTPDTGVQRAYREAYGI